MTIEFIVTITLTAISTIGLLFILRHNWKRYGLLFLLSCLVGHTLCYIFVSLGFYSFPYRLFPSLSSMPIIPILTIFPFYVLLGVRYSPTSWGWKIPFYWVLIHIGMSMETWAQSRTQLIRYEQFWDLWDSYTWWWLYFLLFEWIGGLVVPSRDRKPLSVDRLRFGTIGWFLLHFVLITTIFLAGFYTARSIGS
ncbi:hypothetical protein LOK74_04755 [Brevibacillus humidisoli]|uniref:CBO0543 family protein n=1 Tax=Brevibacillus humidisoli TaxID=2895522 RepID=UPI001E431C04|nr:CBO0543 family protein [Brevibacillus humidisoli]UFJ41818.1 hypothetical protein LOK74_04755 [Brevibacillus humidisoli]